MEYKQSGNFLKSGLMTALAFTILSSPFALSNHSLSFEKAEFSTTNSVMEKIDKTYNSKLEAKQKNCDDSYYKSNEIEDKKETYADNDKNLKDKVW